MNINLLPFACAALAFVMVGCADQPTPSDAQGENVDPVGSVTVQSWWADPPTTEMLDAGWEDWPSWSGYADDLTPIDTCPRPGPPLLNMAESVLAGSPKPLPSSPFRVADEDGGNDQQWAWTIDVASWNLLNFSRRKAYSNAAYTAERTQLLDQMAAIMQPYDIVFLQEILAGWTGFPAPLGTRMSANGFICGVTPPELGWVGRKEIFGYCYKPSTGGGKIGISLNSQSSTASTTGLIPPSGGATTYCGQKIWMRAPAASTFTVTPQDDTPVSFSFLNNHTKPEYNGKVLPGGSKNPKTPSWYPTTRPASFPTGGSTGWPIKNASVYYELKAINDNLSKLTSGNIIVLGDLNADCASLPNYLRNTVLNGAGWNWYITQGTNTGRIRNSAQANATRSECAYDRFILNNAANAYYVRPPSVFKTGIAQRLNHKQVSDHYLVSMSLGKKGKKRSKGQVTTKVPAAEGEPLRKKRAFNKPSSGSSVTATIAGTDLHVYNAVGGTVNSAKLYVVRYVEDSLFQSSARFNLHDVRQKGPDSILINADGSIALTEGGAPTWSIGPADVGLYRLALDVDQDGVFDASAGDYVTRPTGFDVTVFDASSMVMDGDVVTLGDNGKTRDLFSGGKAINIYAYAENISPAYESVHTFVISRQRLEANYPAVSAADWTWESAKAWPTKMALVPSAIPVNQTSGPVIVSEVTTDLAARNWDVAPDGTALSFAWNNPATLFSGKAYLTGSPPPPPPAAAQSAYDTLAMFGDGCKSDPEEIGVTQQDFNTICNAADPFVNLYGDVFNVVFDVNKNGIFDGPDLVDAKDISALESYFAGGATSMGKGATNTAAVTQFQKMLVATSNMRAIPPTYGVYGSTTEELSQFLLCNHELTRTVFNSTVKPRSQSGFMLFAETEYEAAREQGTYLQRYVNLILDDSFTANSSVYQADYGLSIDSGANFSQPACYVSGGYVDINSGTYAFKGSSSETTHTILASPFPGTPRTDPVVIIRENTIIQTVALGVVVILLAPIGL